MHVCRILFYSRVFFYNSALPPGLTNEPVARRFMDCAIMGIRMRVEERRIFMNVWEISKRIADWYDSVPGGRLTIGLLMLAVLILFLFAMSRIERMKERKVLRIKQQRTKSLLDHERQLKGGVTTWHV
jgi:hypothetical protein